MASETPKWCIEGEILETCEGLQCEKEQRWKVPTWSEERMIILIVIQSLLT